VIHVVGAGAFQLSDPVAGQQGRRYGHGEMDVVFDSANGVEQYAGRLQNTAPQPAVELSLELGGDCWGVILRVPGDMQVDF